MRELMFAGRVYRQEKKTRGDSTYVKAGLLDRQRVPERDAKGNRTGKYIFENRWADLVAYGKLGDRLLEMAVGTAVVGHGSQHVEVFNGAVSETITVNAIQMAPQNAPPKGEEEAAPVEGITTSATTAPVEEKTPAPTPVGAAVGATDEDENDPFADD